MRNRAQLSRLKMADYDDVTMSLYRDVSDDVATSSMTDPETPGCLLYKFVVDCVNGLVCVLGFVGNLIAFAVFYKDTMKTSTSFLFQVVLSMFLLGESSEKSKKSKVRLYCCDLLKGFKRL